MFAKGTASVLLGYCVLGVEIRQARMETISVPKVKRAERCFSGG